MDRAPPPTLAAVGVGQHLADRAHKDAAIPVGRFEDPLVKEHFPTVARFSDGTLGIKAGKRVIRTPNHGHT